MAEPFLGEIRIFSFSDFFGPQGWANCDGQFLPINQNQALFSLLGTMYGGNGQTNFALPDLRGRTPMHVAGSHIQGEKAGEQAHTLTLGEMPQHSHFLQASSNNASTNSPNGAVLANATAVYHTPSNLVALSPSSIANTGGSQAHLNMQPFLTLRFCIALVGIFPRRN